MMWGEQKAICLDEIIELNNELHAELRGGVLLGIRESIPLDWIRFERKRFGCGVGIKY